MNIFDIAFVMLLIGCVFSDFSTGLPFAFGRLATMALALLALPHVVPPAMDWLLGAGSSEELALPIACAVSLLLLLMAGDVATRMIVRRRKGEKPGSASRIAAALVGVARSTLLGLVLALATVLLPPSAVKRFWQGSFLLPYAGQILFAVKNSEALPDNAAAVFARIEFDLFWQPHLRNRITVPAPEDSEPLPNYSA